MSEKLKPQVLRLTNAFELLGRGEHAIIDKSFKVWFSERCKGLEAELIDAIPQRMNLKHMRTFIKEMRNLENVLTTAARDACEIGNFLEEMSDAALPSEKKGILCLSDAILSSVFLYYRGSYNSMRLLSLVCKKFRSVVLQTPDLWSVISYTSGVQDESYVWELLLERSKSSALTVHIDVSDFSDQASREKIAKFSHSVGKQSHRWKELIIDSRGASNGLKALDESLRGISLPNLDRLRILSDQIHSNQRNHMKELFSSWSLPAQMTYYGGNLMNPLASWRSRQTANVLECDLIVDPKTFNATAQSFYDCLSRLHICQSLSIIVKGIFIQAGYNSQLITRTAQTDLQAHMCMPHIRHLKLFLSIPIQPKDYFFTYLLTYMIPVMRLSEFTLRLHADLIVEELWDHTSRTVITHTGVFEMLETFNILYAPSVTSKIPLDSRQMPKLKHLNIADFEGQEPTKRFSLLSSSYILPLQLESVSFTNCRNLSLGYIVDIAMTLAQIKIQKLTFFDCGLTMKAKDNLKAVLPGKVVWVEEHVSGRT